MQKCHIFWAKKYTSLTKVHHRRMCGCDKYQLCIWLRMEVICVKELQTFKKTCILHNQVFCSPYTPLNHFTWMIREALPYRCFPTATHSHQDKPHLSFASKGCLERWSWTSWSGERKKWPHLHMFSSTSLTVQNTGARLWWERFLIWRWRHFDEL